MVYGMLSTPHTTLHITVRLIVKFLEKCNRPQYNLGTSSRPRSFRMLSENAITVLHLVLITSHGNISK